MVRRWFYMISAVVLTVVLTGAFFAPRDVYRVGYEWCAHSIAPAEPLQEHPRVEIGGPDCEQPYSASLLNVSAMSYGALSKNAILALNLGAKRGHFAHNTKGGRHLAVPPGT